MKEWTSLNWKWIGTRRNSNSGLWLLDRRRKIT